MAGKIIADTLEHSTAGSVTTDYVVNGSAKAWVNLDGTGTATIRGSLNLSGLVDDGVGEYTINFSNNMGNANYSVSGSAKNTVNALIASNNAFTSSNAEISSNTTTAFGDNSQLCASLHICLLYTSPSPRDGLLSRMPSSA